MKYIKSINDYIRSRSLITLLSVSIIAVSVITILIIGAYWISAEFRLFQRESDNLQAAFVEEQKEIIRKEVESVIEYIEYNRSLSQERIKKDLKLRVDQAWEISNNIYIENRASKSNAGIEKMVKDALRPIRFNNGREAIFIYSTDGLSVMLPKHRAFENRSGLDLRDSLGNYPVKNEINLLKEVDKGFLTYNAPAEFPHGDSVIFKVTYIRKFAPFNWYLGSKVYMKEFEQDLKQDLLERLSNIRYSFEGYIFINTLDGKALVTNGSKPDIPVEIFNSNDTNWIRIYQEQLKIVKGEGNGYLDYKFKRLASPDSENKISYISLFRDWGWIVGAGFYSNEIEAEIAAKQKELKANINDFIIRISISLLAVILIIAFFTRMISVRVKNSFSSFTVFFKKASLESSLIDTAKLSFAEFRNLAMFVNNTITERDHARKALKNEEALLRSLIDSTPDFVFFKDLKSNFIGCNKAFASFIGISENDIIGKNDFDLFPREAAEAYYSSDQKIIKDHIPVRNEEWNIFPDGSRKLLDTFKVLYADTNGHVIGIMAISRDITEKEEIQQQFKDAKEKAEEADHLKTAFLANMSHEIRTPMNSIIGFSSLLADESLTSDDRNEYIQHINNSGESLLNLIDDIIDIAKIEAGQLTITIEQCNLDNLMDDLYVTFSDILKRKYVTDVALVYEPGPLSSGNTIMTDPHRLRQVITNLIGNAAKFTSEGSISFGYRQEKSNLLFYVRDTGIGINEADQNVIFKRFRQAKTSGIRHQGGTGLGLAISQHIIGILGGTIWVESSPGKGSVFYFTIPYTPVAPDNMHSKATGTPQHIDWSSKTMLVVESTDSSFSYINTVLSRTGLNLLRAADGQSGIDICQENNSIDLVLMDINLPDMNGYDATKKIKLIRPEMTIIAQTANSLYFDSERSKENGFGDFIIKPVKFNILMSLLSRYLNNQQA